MSSLVLLELLVVSVVATAGLVGLARIEEASRELRGVIAELGEISVQVLALREETAAAGMETILGPESIPTLETR